MKYINKIKNDITDYPYRFKTNEEFENQYGLGWEWRIEHGWIGDAYLGEDFKLSTNKQIIDELIDNEQILFNNENAYKGLYSISRDMITPNYIIFDNSPRQLVYESKMTKDYDVVGVKCKDQDEFTEVQKYLFEKGYDWNGTPSKHRIIHDRNSLFIICKKYDMTLTRLSDCNDLYMNNYLDRNYSTDKHITVNGLTELKKLFQIDYNSKRQLVYENKILKFNKF